MGLRQSPLCCLGEPVFHPLTVWDQQRTVPVELPQQKLCVGLTSFRQLLQFLRCTVPVLQRKCLVPDHLPQFPAIIRLAPYLLRLVVASQVRILESDLPQPDALRLLDDSVFDLPELFLLRQLFLFSGIVVVVAVNFILKGVPLVVARLNHRQFLQFVHYLVHRFLHRFGQIAVGLLALDRLQLRGQLFHLLPDLRN